MNDLDIAVGDVRDFEWAALACETRDDFTRLVRKVRRLRPDIVRLEGSYYCTDHFGVEQSFRFWNYSSSSVGSGWKMWGVRYERP